MYAIGIVADDLTGAMDTAQGFAARGYRTTVVVDPSADPTRPTTSEETAVLSVNTDTRYDEASEAAERVADAVAAVPSRTVYKKVDSTLRGNVAAEVDAALAASGSSLALVAPAFPSAGRTTEDGRHYVDGAPVAETEYAADEKGPSSSSVVDLFDALDRPVATVPLSTVAEGSEAVASALADAVAGGDRPPILVCDAREDAHLAAVAEAGADFDALYVGSGGLAEHVAVSGAAADAGSSFRPSPGAPLGVVGSVSATTLAQLGRLPDEAVIELDGASLLRGADATAAADRASRRLGDGRPAVVTAATDAAAVERTVAAGRALNLSSSEVRDRVAGGLAEAAARILRTESPSGVVATGGDVAVAVARALDATAVALTGDEVEAGIPVGRFADGRVAGVPLVTKAGGFGTEETIVNSLAVLTQENE
jgi:uncharacterized protein YgbK (DUF1537 family)